MHRKNPSDVPKRDKYRPIRLLSRSCYKVAALFVYARMKARARVSVRDGLQLRAWALALLGGQRPDASRLAACSAATWRVFLATERCALALKARMAGAAGDVPPLETAATRELQRVLSARGQLLRIGQLAVAHRMAAIVLKGGVAALASAAPVDLHDVDVLVRPPDAERLAALLDREGFHATGPAGTAHLAQRIAPNAVQIEVHFAIADVDLSEATWSGARPLDGAAGLSRLGAADHLWHLLVHSVVTHPHRRGSLRDVLLVAAGLGDCSAAELSQVERLIAGHPLSQPLGDVLAMARELRDGVPVRDRFRREAAANYVLRGPLAWLGFSRFWTVAFVRALFSQLGSAVERRGEWATAWSRPDFVSPWEFVARLEPRAPRLVRLCRTAVKVVRLMVCRVVVWPVAVAVRGLAAR